MHELHISKSLLILAVYIPFNFVISYCVTFSYLAAYGSIFLSQTTIVSLGTWLLLYNQQGITAFFDATLYSLLPSTFIFLWLLKKYHWGNIQLLIEQIKFALPLSIHGILYTLLFSVDRIIIKNACGLEMLGHHALLIRFSGIFHIITLSVASTWPILCFQAYQEENNTTLVASIITYFSIFLLVGYFAALIASWMALRLLFPHYLELMHILPLFFAPLVILSLAQLFSVGCNITRRTVCLPFLTAGLLFIQYAASSLAISYGLTGMLISNSIVFALYALLTNKISNHIAGPVIDTNKIITLGLLGIFYYTGLNLIIYFNAGLLIAGSFIITLPLAIMYRGIIDAEWLACKNSTDYYL